MPRRNHPSTQNPPGSDLSQAQDRDDSQSSPPTTIPTALTPQIEVPYRQIRALYDDETITVYQAYQASIAIPAIKEQKISASKDFAMGRMTWIKPSWCWMMYRSGYSFKDPRQSHILALKIPHRHFKHILSLAAVTSSHGGPLAAEQRSKPIRVQWDPERGPRLEVLPYRSIQIGIGGDGELKRQWAEEWIVGIEDVTERARALLEAVNEGKGKGERLSAEKAVARGLMPMERAYEVDEELRGVLRMEDKE